MNARSKYNVELSLIEPPPRDELDDFLDSALNNDPKIDKWFYSKVAGVTHDNEDGTSRQLEIQKCEPLDPLVLIHEAQNPVDQKAIAIYSMRKIKLGYLNERLAHEILAKANKGERWTALVARKRGGADEQNNTFGLAIVMVKMKEQQ